MPRVRRVANAEEYDVDEYGDADMDQVDVDDSDEDDQIGMGADPDLSMTTIRIVEPDVMLFRANGTTSNEYVTW